MNFGMIRIQLGNPMKGQSFDQCSKHFNFIELQQCSAGCCFRAVETTNQILVPLFLQVTDAITIFRL